MKTTTFAIIILTTTVMFLACRTRARDLQTRDSQGPPQQSSPQKSSSQPGPEQDVGAAGRGLRLMMLTTSPKEIEISPSAEFPRVYGVLMDWPIPQSITATVVAASDGTASLYTTSSFGILGGQNHESVRTAAKKFVKGADRFYDAAKPTKEYSYPAADRVRFYLLTFDGVRVIDTDFASINNHTSKYVELFSLGQDVLTELRQISEKTK
jgi:hypothetical protein